MGESPRPSRWALAVCVLALAAVGGAWALATSIRKNPNVVYLSSGQGAHWIRPDAPSSIRIHNLGVFRTYFRFQFDVDRVVADAVLTLNGLTDFSVSLDAREILAERDDRTFWKESRSVDLTSFLAPGHHEIIVAVTNENGPRLIRAYCAELGIATDRDWEAREDDGVWAAAVTADDISPTPLSLSFESPASAVLGLWPFLSITFLAGAVCVYIPAERHPPWLRRATPSPGTFRWILLTAWLALGANNMIKIPFHIGFDIEGHINYINYIAQHKSLPLADEGWQMFQTPLYYLVSAVPHWILSKFSELDAVIQQLRFIPLLCGAALVEICYQTSRLVFPERADLQILGTAFGGLLPISLYMSQAIGNEPMAGMLTAASVYLALRLLIQRDEHAGGRRLQLLAFVLGLAILTKVTAVLLIPVYLGSFGYLAWTLPADESAGERVSAFARNSLAFLAVLAIVSGWYFWMNYSAFGKPMVGGWDPVRELPWWQDPGYRTPSQLFGFGEALRQPVTAGVAGLCDAFYSTFWLDGLMGSLVNSGTAPPWNHRFVIAGAWLGLVPTLALLLGLAQVVWYPKEAMRNALWLPVCAVAIYFAAFAWLFLTLPVYSTGKASYTLGLAPCYAIILCAGFRSLDGSRILRAILGGGLACYIAAVYAAYFVLPGSS